MWGYGLLAAGSMLVALLLAVSHQHGGKGRWLIAAVAMNAAWAVVLALDARGELPAGARYWAEILRAAGWIAAISAIGHRLLAPLLLRMVWLAMAALLLLGLAAALQVWPDLSTVTMLLSPAGLAISVLVLVMLEQLFRNAAASARWGLKFLVLAIGGSYAYDFFIYAESIMLGTFTHDAWQARGFVGLAMLPLLLVAARRTPQWQLDVFVSRQVTFYTGAILSVGAYALLMAAGGYLIAWTGGAWGLLLQIAFLACAAALLSTLVFSTGVRRRVQVFIAKHFYRNKYDYRVEWLRFVRTLSESASVNVALTAARAVAQIFSSPHCSLMVVDRDDRQLVPQGAWPAAAASDLGIIAMDSELARYLLRTRWVIDLHEYRERPSLYDNVRMPEWLTSTQVVRVLAPLISGDSLVGLVAFKEPPPPFELTYEDRDLLKTVCQHLATLVAQHLADQRLAESRQFEAHGRMTAFMMHDLKNSAAQLQLIVRNAEHHRSSPEFVADAISTVDNAVDRINRLIQQLRGSEAAAPATVVALGGLLDGALRRCSDRQPLPRLTTVLLSCHVRCDAIRLAAIFEHVLRNAQDATAPNGRIAVAATASADLATVTIRDSGTGMSEEFLRDRLFRPFDSTKGARGMGIGAFQVREYVRELGGEVKVTSVPRQGTEFSIMLPVSPDPARSRTGG